MVSFQLSKEIKKDVFRLFKSVGLVQDSIYKHYAIDIADHSSMQDACHLNFVIHLAHRGVSMAQWWSIGARNPFVLSSILHGNSIFFSQSHARNKTKKTSFFISLPSSKLTISLICNIYYLRSKNCEPCEVTQMCSTVINYVHQALI